MNEKTNRFDTINISSFLNEFESRLEDAAIRYKEALWNYYLHRQTESFQDIEKELTGIMLNADLYHTLDFHSRRPQDDVTIRRIHLLLSEIRKMRIDGDSEHNQCVQAIREELNNWMIPFNGKNVSVYQIQQYINRQPDRGKRRLAYESLHAGLGNLNAAWRSMIETRNRLACDYGYTDFTEYVLSLLETDETALNGIANIAALYQYFSRTVGVELEAYDLSFFVTRLNHELNRAEFPADKAQFAILQTLERIGLDFGRLPLHTVDAGPDFPALCIPVAVPSDIRMMICSGSSFDAYAHQAREYGRACHYASIREDFYSLKTVNPVLLNVSAALFYHIFSEREKLSKITGDSALTEDWLQKKQSYDAAQLMMFGCLAEFEMKLYREPFENLDKLWNQVCSKYFGFREPQISDWKIQEWYISRPFRSLELAVSEKIADKIFKKIREMPDNLWGSFITENIFIHGNRVSWRNLISDCMD